jgi:hypothetical protein
VSSFVTNSDNDDSDASKDYADYECDDNDKTDD